MIKRSFSRARKERGKRKLFLLGNESCNTSSWLSVFTKSYTTAMLDETPKLYKQQLYPI
jgi:hypothetical protein